MPLAWHHTDTLSMMTTISYLNAIDFKLLRRCLPLRLRPAVCVHDLLLVVAEIILPELPHAAERVRKTEGGKARGLHLLEKSVGE